MRRRGKLYWPFVAPALIVYCALFAGPAIYGVYVSFLRWRGQGDPQVWVGLSNYARLWHDDVFHRAFLNTVGLLVVAGVAVFALSFFVVTVLRELPRRRLIQSVLFVPYMLSPIAIGIALGLVLSPNGPVNSLLGLQTVWLAPGMLYKSVLAGLVWVSSGFYIMIIMAGVSRIPKYFYEACQLDGAGTWRQFWTITLPLTWDVVSVAAVLWTINTVKVFEFVYGFVGIASDSPPIQARTLTIQQFLTTTGGRTPQYDMGSGSAMAVVMVLLIVGLVIVLRRVMRRDPIEF
ncbi:carbohydrate ABC transporter permease [Nonomuraea sediminis]|uniref:carbohydrate ABC transporter permease n=1 Tax=Nonomuraea sediminis TaxID=2835864 RepID=UPI001BDD3BDC|nr:sugar ABC transporter permease [Nonomuraea sediminis]